MARLCAEIRQQLLQVQRMIVLQRYYKEIVLLHGFVSPFALSIKRIAW